MVDLDSRRTGPRLLGRREEWLVTDEGIKALEKVVHQLELWRAAEAARTKAWWETQHSLNKTVDARMCKAERRISDLDLKVMWWSGFAAAMGSVLGALISHFIRIGGAV